MKFSSSPSGNHVTPMAAIDCMNDESTWMSGASTSSGTILGSSAGFQPLARNRRGTA